MVESLKAPNQHLTVTNRGTMGDPRTHYIDESKLFYAYCKVRASCMCHSCVACLGHSWWGCHPWTVFPFQGMFRDQGIVMFYTSLIQVVNVDSDNGLIATGKKNRLAFFKVHKIEDGGIRMFESVVHPGHFIRLKETHVDILVHLPKNPLDLSNHQGWPQVANCIETALVFLEAIELLQGNGDRSCHFCVDKVREAGYVTLQSCQNPKLFLGMTEHGDVKPTENTGTARTHFYPEVIECKYEQISTNN